MPPPRHHTQGNELLKECHHCTTPFDGRGLYCADCRDTASPWRLDEAMVRQACTELGIELTVRIRRTNLPVAYGTYHGIRKRRGDGTTRGQIAEFTGRRRLNEYHLITIIPRLTPAFASRVLWHELAHARDRERNPHFRRACRPIARKLKQEAKREGRSEWSAYASYPWEIRASATEELHDICGSLTLSNLRASMPFSERSPLIERVDHGHIVFAPTFEDAVESSMRRSILSAHHQRHLERTTGEHSPLTRHRRREERNLKRSRGDHPRRTRPAPHPETVTLEAQRARLRALRQRLTDRRNVAVRRRGEQDAGSQNPAQREPNSAARLRLQELHILEVARRAHRTAKRRDVESAILVRPEDVTADDATQAIRRDAGRRDSPQA